MQKMGYKEGQGLGKECQGRTGIIEVTVRPPNLGLGAGTPVAKKQAWEVKKEEERLARLKAEQELKDSAERNEHVETLRMQVKAARAELYSKETQVSFDTAKVYSEPCLCWRMLHHTLKSSHCSLRASTNMANSLERRRLDLTKQSLTYVIF